MFWWNYNREGPGISKDAPQKEGLDLFWDIFKREFTSLIKLNLIFIVSCIPIITIGPAIGAMTFVTVKMVQDKPSDLFYDFRRSFKKNWKSSFLLGLLELILISILIFSMVLCLKKKELIYNIIISIIIVTSVLIGNFFVYIFPMSVSVDLSLSVILKNSILLSIANIKYSFLTLVLCIGLAEISFILFPLTVPFILLFTFSFISFISSFCAWGSIKKFIIKGVK